MFAWLFSLDYRRRRLLKRAAAGPLRDYLAVPFTSIKADCRATEFVALDLETTGLDAASDEIVSVGWVGLRGGRIDLASAGRRLARPSRAMPEASAVVHRITDDRAAEGGALEEVLAELLPRLAGRVMVAHHARVELDFLDAACRRLWGAGFLIPVVDTEWIARRALERSQRPLRPGGLRLAALREGYNLPRYRAHDALSDAVAAAELFAAQLAERTPDGRRLPLSDLLLRR